MKSFKNKILISAFNISVVIVIGILAYNQVDIDLTDEDYTYIKKILEESDVKQLSRVANYDDEIKFIIGTQRAVLEMASKREGIPHNFHREPKDVFLARKGLCYDKSRVIEKVLEASDLKTRHIAAYSTRGTNSKLVALFTRGVPSHAITEVLTSKGWLVVDSNNHWVSRDAQGEPISLAQIQAYLNKKDSIIWENDNVPRFYTKPFTYVFGLYSRHGKFYPPFNSIPDINYKQLLANFF